jgi:hypothetical protein
MLSASAVFAAIGVPAVAAAAAAARHADAELIAACARFEEIEREMPAVYDDLALVDADARETAVQALSDERDDLLATMDELRAQTAAGIVARARLLAAHNGDEDHSWDWPGTVAYEILAFLMRDAAAFGGAA